MKIKHIYIIILLALTFSCEEEFDRKFKGQFVEFTKALSGSSSNYTVPDLGQVVRDSVLIQLVGVNNGPVDVQWEVDVANTTATEGVHYNLISPNTLTIGAGESFAKIEFDVILDGFATTEVRSELDIPRTISFRLTGGDATIEPNVNTITHTMVPICPACLNVWRGPMITFTKADNADWTLEANQDRITDDVWITRQNQWSIFNIAKGDISGFTACDDSEPSGGQPLGTLWAFGTTDDIASLNFGTFLGDLACQPGNNLPFNTPIVLYLVEEDAYIDLQFLSWTRGGGGGGFSYMRSTKE